MIKVHCTHMGNVIMQPIGGAILGFKLRALHLLGRHSTHLNHTPALKSIILYNQYMLIKKKKRRKKRFIT
jgi:hypothetical protein